MSTNLHVPAIRTGSMRKSGSSSSLRHSVEQENELAPVTRSRRNSDSHVPAAPRALDRPPSQHVKDTTLLYAGRAHKALVFDTAQLKAKVPYFKKLLTETPDPSPEQTTFEDADEASLALFHSWVGGKALHGPTDWHSIGHYLGLYALAWKFGCEDLENRVVDLIRAHYAKEQMTAPPYRLEYIHTYAPHSLMESFLFTTAAFRCMTSREEPAISAVMKSTMARDSEMAAEFADALVRVHRAEGKDARHGPSCPAWHVHQVTKMCAPEMEEAWAPE